MSSSNTVPSPSNGSARFERHIDIREGGKKAIDWLADHCTLSRSALKEAMHQGAVWLTRGKTSRIRRASKILKYGDQLHLYFDSEILAEQPKEPRLISDENNYSVWYKPFGVRCQGSKYGDHCTLYRWVEIHLQPERPSFTVHRLDRATEGLILVAHDKATAAALASQFEKREVEKRYRAIVSGQLQLDDVLIDTPVNGKGARSRVTTLAIDVEGDRTLVEVLLETGRKHQIRQHLASLGHPVLGDRLYGDGVNDGLDLQLQSCLLRIHCPDCDKERSFQLPEQQLLSLDAILGG
ncbi:MAG: RluA family pseudouridine synthase [Motiliproteus sp.]|nr:RluA family pseudouridine synthase [Motiliproteus sp.]MCW9052125.1 RluA family pseudouridine synthase [Motiliproteus sp.]